jgi:diadenosine tetraphosphate (Ap4A) HIT family hydrolase
VADESRHEAGSGNEIACIFCDRIASADLVAEAPLAVAFLDAFPVSPGHTLVVPRRHEPDFFTLSREERMAMFDLLAEVEQLTNAARRPAGYNVGLNVGQAAGQTVAHAHLHLIPRYAGDQPDPRGGIRWVIPARAVYWDQLPP